MEGLDEFLERDRDRELFDLAPRNTGGGKGTMMMETDPSEETDKAEDDRTREDRVELGLRRSMDRDEEYPTGVTIATVQNPTLRVVAWCP